MQKGLIFGGITLIIIIVIAVVTGGSGTEAPVEADVDAAPGETPVVLETEGVGTAAYVLDADASTLAWQAAKVIGSPHAGTTDFSSGDLTFEKGVFQEGSFIIDLTTIESDEGLDSLVDHLKNEDFFDVENFPISTIEVTSMDALEDSDMMYTLTGDLTILGETHEVTFPAEVIVTDGIMTAHAEFEIDRTVWGMTFSSGSIFKQLGDAAIKDDIAYTLDLVFEAAPEGIK
jgi:polyisoprenoid-binding protein YceI